MKSSLFPVIDQPPQPVPLWIAQMAYGEYLKRHSQQSFEYLAQHDGFGQTELIDLLANYAQGLDRALRHAHGLLVAGRTAGHDWRLAVVEAQNFIAETLSGETGR